MIQQLLRHGLWLSCLVWVTSAFGQSPADASAPAESLAHSGPADVVVSPADSSAMRVFVDTTDVQILHATSQRIRDLLGDTLQAEVIPADLFDLPLDDDAAIRVEVERLGAVLGEQGPVPGGRPATHARDGETHSQQGDTPDSLQAGADSLLLAARLDLDRARLDFYSLPKARRDSLVQKQTQRWRETAGARQAAELDQAEKRQRDALAERQRSIEDAAHARTEAERLINEEQARLLGIQAEQASVSADMLRARQALALGGELSLSYHRRIRELQDAGQIADSADGLYDELRQHLRTSRDQLARAISMVAAPSVVPTAGEDPLGSLMSGVDRTAIDRIRLEIDATSVQLRLRERRLRLDQAGQLYDDVRALNADRLKLLGFLSSERRGRIIHFGADGLDQALAEVRQVSLVLSYHLMVSRNWITTLGSSSSTLGWSAVTFGMVLLKWIFTLGLFLWWRKRGDELLQQWRERIREEDRRQRAVLPSRLIIVLDSLRQIRGPLDWLLLVILLVWALPTETAAQLEVRLLATVLFWAFGGALAVDVINTIASHQEQTRPLGALSPHGTLRLRSLRLVGRTVVVFGLILVLSIQLVGRGTIYNWVFSICWFAAIPVALVILRWWRVVILERIDANRKKRPLERWVLQNRSGWKSFPAVAAGGVYLFTRGALRILRNRVSRFNLTRRTLAWLFRRGMDRLADEKSGLQFAELPASVFSIMGPEHQSANDVSGEGDAQVQRVLERIRRTGGGVFAVVGERGGGKSAVLHRVQELHPDTLLLDCPVTGPEGLRQAFASRLALDANSTLETCAAALNQPERDPALLIDNAHLLIQPMMGGLTQFDHIVDVARHNSTQCAWFFAMDEVIWRFLVRARGSRPLFDDVIMLGSWREEDISNLLVTRSREAGIEPDFEHMLEPLPTDADEYDREEALARASAGYYRLLWDYSSGNPGVALHMWRRSLGVGEDGRVFVKLFQAPDTRELEQLPDPAVFVLRAVIQMEPVRVEDVVRATMLGLSQVENALRYGLARGYFLREGERYRVSWAWFRAITRFLQRRHLLASH